ncbi:MAG TPA: TetR/AcrR family transcriptional regulator [Thermoanaerobaculia bacterium]|nr:TetR/AcrR family transcriptional regulator [Thermoanaerobaculia bacterium]
MGRPPTIDRERLLATARRIFVQKGFAAATLADIARELRVTPAALLRHVSSKQELFELAMQRGERVVPDFILELRHVDASEDPRKVLRNLAERMIPFLRGRIEEGLGAYVHARSLAITIPRDADGSTPPARALALLENYFERAMAAKKIRTFPPRTAAFLFLGNLMSYVLLNFVFRVTPEPYPLGRYIDGLVDLWSEGAILPARRRSGGRRGQRPKVSR